MSDSKRSNGNNTGNLPPVDPRFIDKQKTSDQFKVPTEQKSSNDLPQASTPPIGRKYKPSPLRQSQINSQRHYSTPTKKTEHFIETNTPIAELLRAARVEGGAQKFTEKQTVAKKPTGPPPSVRPTTRRGGVRSAIWGASSGYLNKSSRPANAAGITSYLNDPETHIHSLDPSQHGLDARNPYHTLVDDPRNVPVIVIHALGSANAPHMPSDLQKTGMITMPAGGKIRASLDPAYLIASAQISAELGGPNSMHLVRVTQWAQETMDCGKKSPKIKLKTGKGGITGGFIPVKLSSTTYEVDGKLMALKQNPLDIPSPEEKNITTIQMPKPLYQFFEGLKKVPPEFVILNKEDIGNTGFIEFKVNCNQSGIDQDTYRIDLRQALREHPKETEAPFKKVETNAEQPDWWDKEKFGDFETQKHQGFHVEIQEQNESDFKPFMVYAEIDKKDGKARPITGDYDGYLGLRSEIYQLGDLATEEVDTHANNGVKELITKLKSVNEQIIDQDLKAGRITEAEIQKRTDNFAKFVDSSHDYIESLGIVTPYEAYFTIHLNNRTAQIREYYKDKPQELEALLAAVSIEQSNGLEKIKGDYDQNPEWLRKDPVGQNKLVQEKLSAGYHVPPEVLHLHLEYLTKTGQQSYEANSELLSGMEKDIASIVSNKSDWKIYATFKTDEVPPHLEGRKPLPPDPPDPRYDKMKEVGKMTAAEKNAIKDFVIVTDNDGGKKDVIFVTKNGISSSLTGEQGGLAHIEEFKGQVQQDKRSALRV